MGTTIGITGHSSGFGEHIAEACKEKGYKVVGFSTSNNYYFPNDVEKIFEEKFDVIINNTEFSTTQVNVALLANNKNINCINIGSKITEAEVESQYLTMKHNKIALMNLSKAIGQKYLTWGFLEGHWILEKNPHLLETITINDAVKDVMNALELVLNS